MELLWTIVLTVAVVYILTAICFFLFPSLVHQNHTGTLPGGVAIAAHRGGAGEFIENTMAAFDHSVRLGVDMLEIDVQETKDGVIVVSHDNDMYRTTGKRGEISETLYADLPAYKNNIFLQFGRVQCRSSQTDYSFVKLDELFERHKEVVIHLDTKVGKPSLVNSVSEIILKHNRLKNTVWGNFNEAKADLCYAVNPDVNMCMSQRKVVITYIMFYVGLIGLCPMKEAVFDIPMPSTISQQFNDMLSLGQKVLARLAHFLMMNRLLFWHMRRRGIKVLVYVLNKDTDFAAATRYKVDGIMTDFPSRLVEFHGTGRSKDKLSSEQDTRQILGRSEE